MFLLFKTNLCFAVTLALCVSWNLGSHSWSRYQPIIRSKCRDTCFHLCNPEIFKNWVNNIKLFQILWRKNHDHTYVLNVKCISSPAICGIESTDGTKYDCIDRFGLQVMKICWGDNKSKLHINYQFILPCDSSNFFVEWHWSPPYPHFLKLVPRKTLFCEVLALTLEMGLKCEKVSTCLRALPAEM